jgi:lipoprotein-anchoring transpeptidase ErfK/SrfK
VNPAHLGRVVFGAAITATLTTGIAVAIQGAPDQSAPAPVQTEPQRAYARLLTAPLHREATTPSLQSANHAEPVHASPCASNANGQLVLVSISRQHLWTCTGHHLVMSTPVTTGKTLPGDATPRGSFAVEDRVANTTLHPASGLVIPVAYWIPFDGNVYGFHNAPWQTMPYGSSDYRTEGSIGCVHVPLLALRELFNWVHEGATVRIR